MVDGSKRDTGKSWGGINIIGQATGSSINFATSEGNNNAPANRMIISKEGYITHPYNPSFDAYSPDKTSQGNVVVWSSTRHNTGGHFNTSNGRFTAPIAGVYHFSFNILMGDPYSGSYHRMYWRLNGNIASTYGDSLEDTGGKTDYATVSMSWTVKLNAGDYIETWNDGPIQTYGSQYGQFGGYLIG
jgi:hypothetical protein